MNDRSAAYAQAIVGIAKSENALDVVDDELLRVARAVRDDRDLHETLTNQRYPVGERLEVVDEILGAAHPATRSAVSLLVSGGRVRQLDEIATRVAEIASEERQRALAEVYVATPLDEGRRERLREALQRATGKQLDVKVFVDPSVIGGVRAKIGDTVIDGSLARRFEDIRARLGG